jgi:2-methylcitrate dehydratase PrpD
MGGYNKMTLTAFKKIEYPNYPYFLDCHYHDDDFTFSYHLYFTNFQINMFYCKVREKINIDIYKGYEKNSRKKYEKIMDNVQDEKELLKYFEIAYNKCMQELENV